MSDCYGICCSRDSNIVFHVGLESDYAAVFCIKEVYVAINHCYVLVSILFDVCIALLCVRVYEFQGDVLFPWKLFCR